MPTKYVNSQVQTEQRACLSNCSHRN